MAKSRIILKIPDRDVLLSELNFLYERGYKARGTQANSYQFNTPKNNRN